MNETTGAMFDLDQLRRLMRAQQHLLSLLDCDTILWFEVARLRQETIRQVMDLSPTTRELLGVDPVTVMCVL